MKKLVLVIVTFIIAILVGFFGTQLMESALYNRVSPSSTVSGGGGTSSVAKSTPQDVTPPTEVAPDFAEGANKNLTTQSVKDVLDSLHTPIIENAGTAVLSVSMTEYHYTLVGVKASIPGGDTIEYELSSKDDPLFVQTSRTGSFSNLQATPSGTYSLTVKNIDKGITISSIDISGFVARKPIQSLTESDLESIYTSGTWPANRQQFENKFRKGYKITYNGTDTESEINALPSTHQELFQKFKTGIWSSMAVTSIEYDALGYISSFNVNYVK